MQIISDTRRNSQQVDLLLYLAAFLTKLPYTKLSSRIVDRILVWSDRGGES